MNKASGGDGIPVELFQILKDDAVKCSTQYSSKSGKLSSGHRTGKVQFSFQSHNIHIYKYISHSILSDPIDCSLQAPLFMEFSRKDYWSG